MSLESYVLRVLCSYSLSVLEARDKYEQEKKEREANAKKEADDKARFQSYQTNNFLKKKFETQRQRDALTVLAPSCPVL